MAADEALIRHTTLTLSPIGVSRSGVPHDQLLETLRPINRLALSYAPASARAPLLALFALDVRLAGIVRNSREPMLAQLRLAWWREQLSQDSSKWPEGEPLLVALRAWDNRHSALLPLIDAWEGMTGAAPLDGSAFLQLADARGCAFAALVEDARAGDNARRMGRNWALADIAGRLSNAEERATVAALLREQDWRPARLPRKLRPLVVLHGMAARSLHTGENGVRISLSSLFAAMRMGLFGR